MKTKEFGWWDLLTAKCYRVRLSERGPNAWAVWWRYWFSPTWHEGHATFSNAQHAEYAAEDARNGNYWGV